MQIGVSRTEPTSSVPMRAVKDRSRDGRALANPESGARITPRPEGALVQPLDRQRVVGGLRQNCQREFAHARKHPCQAVPLSIWPDSGPLAGGVAHPW